MDADELLNDIQPQSSRIALAASWMAPAPEVASSQPEAELAPELALEVPKENPEAEAEMAAAETTETDAANQLETEKTDLASSVQATAQAKAEPLTDSPGAEQEEEIADFNLSEALAQRDYTPLVVAQIYKAIRYPNRAADKNQQGTVRIGVTINRSGKLVSAITTQESKYRLLNQAALKAVKKAAPFPELPEEMKADSFEVNLPITFRLQ